MVTSFYATITYIFYILFMVDGFQCIGVTCSLNMVELYIIMNNCQGPDQEESFISFPTLSCFWLIFGHFVDVAQFLAKLKRKLLRTKVETKF